MRISTWNVNGLRARLDFVRIWLEERAPDVVGLQELKLPDDDFPHEFFDSLGYKALVHGQKSWNGVAVLTREDATVKQVGLPGGEDMGARLITAEVGELEFTTVYCPNGKTLAHDDYGRKLAWYDALIEHWQGESRKDAAVICGDFNIAPTALDSWRGTDAEGDIFHTEAERTRMQALLDCGLHDLYRAVSPEEQAFSWWDYRGGAFHRKQGLRIDFILGTDAVRARLKSSVIDRDFRKKKDGLTASDHAPVIAEIE